VIVKTMYALSLPVCQLARLKSQYPLWEWKPVSKDDPAMQGLKGSIVLVKNDI
jgi:hypothetical protein